MDNYNPFISIVIRNHNGGEFLPFVFAALEKQEYRFFEIIFVDNQSTDNSIDLAQNAGVKFLSIKNFTYGKALNLGIDASRGELVVILSSHCIPLGHYFLNECIRPFNDTRVGAARLLYVGKKADTSRLLNAETLSSPNDDFISKGPLASGCVIRRSAWQEVPFDEETLAAEDKIWTAEILKKGYLIKSPIPAFYYYRKELSDTLELHKNYREILAIHRRFGIRIGFVRQSGYRAVADCLFGIVSEFGFFLKRVRYEFVRAYLRLRFPKI